MKELRQYVKDYGPFAVFALIWVGLIVSGKLSIPSWDAVWRLPEAAGYWFILSWAFDHWLWKFTSFKWLSAVPDLNGTWEGTLQTTWKDEAGKIPGPKRVILVVRQRFSSIHCILYSDESFSTSFAEKLAEEDDGRIVLSYGYHNVPRADVRHHSVPNDGAAILNVGSKPERLLQGNYFTDRMSTGRIEFRYACPEHLDSFPRKALLNQE